MTFHNTKFEGLKIVEFFRAPDERGVFIKPWLKSAANDQFGAAAEIYFSHSKKGVLRGLHYQRGSFAQKKFVVCLSGKIEDIAVDLRPHSPTKGKVFKMTLTGMQNTGVIIPEGFAHAIFAHDESTIVNVCDKPYHSGEEGGVNWKSVPDINHLPVLAVSSKDATLPNLEDIL